MPSESLPVATQFAQQLLADIKTEQGLARRRLEKSFGPDVLLHIKTDGIPRDMASAEALAHKKDDRLRKEFEKWAVLTYTNNRAVINEKKGADAGIDDDRQVDLVLGPHGRGAQCRDRGLGSLAVGWNGHVGRFIAGAMIHVLRFGSRR